jgi:hypothetical protein
VTPYFIGAVFGFAVAVIGYEVVVLGHVRREISNAKRSINALRPFASAKPVRSDLTDSTPSLHV